MARSVAPTLHSVHGGGRLRFRAKRGAAVSSAHTVPVDELRASWTRIAARPLLGASRSEPKGIPDARKSSKGGVRRETARALASGPRPSVWLSAQGGIYLTQVREDRR
jgi:hypothetical protein